MDSQALGVAPPEARCQLHSGQPFTSVCPRCGTYMCLSCSEAGRFSVCPACRERTVAGTFPFARDQWDWGTLFKHSLEAYKRNFGALSLGLIISLAATVGASLVGALLSIPFADHLVGAVAVQLVIMIPQTLVQGFFTVGILAMSVQAARGQKVELASLFGGAGKLGGYLVQVLVTCLLLVPGVAIAAGPALIAEFALGLDAFTVSLMVLASLVIAGPLFMFVLVSLGFANLELVAQRDVGAVAGLKNAWHIASGQRLQISLGFTIAGALLFAGMLLCGIGALFTGGLALVLISSLYLALRDGARNLTR